MTNKEAIEILKKLGRIGPYEQYETTCMAIAALEKQNGKKPIVEIEKIEGIVEGLPAHRKYMLCPLCNENLRIESRTTKRCFASGTVLKINKNPDFCPKCGQQIDWSDEHGTD